MGEQEIIELTQFEIDSILLISSSKDAIDLKFIVQDFNIYSDIYSSVVSGEITIKDANNILTDYDLCGNEYLYINFNSIDSIKFEKYFRIYKISDVSPLNLNVLKYKIHFCSEEFILNQQYRISKSYKGKYNHEIFLDIMLNYLQVKTERINFDNTVLAQNNLIIPNLKPFEAINMIASFSLNEKVNAPFLFFETQSGFNFKSLDSLIKQKNYNKITINPQNVLDQNDKSSDNRISAYNYDQLFDILNTLSTGGYSSNMIKMNLIGQTREIVSFNSRLNEYKLNKYLPYNKAVNRSGYNILETPSAYTRYSVNFQQDFDERWLLQRANRLSMLNSLRLSLLIDGDSQMEAGMVIELDFPSMIKINTNEETETDKYKSGRYLITSVRHQIINNKYTNYIEVCKDSVIGRYATPETSETYETASGI